MGRSGHGEMSLPLAPLLHAYTARALQPAALAEVPGLGPRFAAIRAARTTLLAEDFLDHAAEPVFREALRNFYDQVVSPPLHGATLDRRAGIVRHGIVALLHGRDSLPARLEQCLTPGRPYFVPGLGPSFWSALAQAIDPDRHPGWTPAIEMGARNLGLARWAPGSGAAILYGRLLEVYGRLLNSGELTSAQQVDHFLTCVAGTTGRTLAADEDPALRWRKAVDRLRAGGGLREQLKVRGQTLARAQHRLAAALESMPQCDGAALLAVLADADPDSASRAPLDPVRHVEALVLWVGRLWETAEVALPTVLEAFWQAEPIPGAGLWLPPAVLHLRDPQQFPTWSEVCRAGYATLDDGPTTGRPAEDYALYREGVTWLRERLTLHPFEVPGLLRNLAPEAAERRGENGAASFEGFGADTFAFLADLAEHNDRQWMTGQRARYRFSVRQPLVELCRALADRYVEPVLHGKFGITFDTAARPGHALTSICKNAFGRAGPYNSVLWITFRPPGPRGEQPQLFVRLDAHGLRFGLRLGRAAKTALQRLRENLQRHGRWILAALQARGALTGCTFGGTDVAGSEPPATVEALQAWANGKSCEASITLPASDPLLASEGLVGEILLSFDRLLPLLVATLEEDAGPALGRLGVAQPESGAYTTTDFLRETYLDGAWLERARGLLELKKQLILQGVPGTGKTKVACSLARLLTQGRDECVRLVQFHPAYTYEEFVEGIKVRTVEVNGRLEPTYPVEEGLLCAFAEQAAAFPAKPHVLIVDEINRGNLPRIFGELLYLLEYREQAVVLPYSRRRFQLPANLYLLGTMNAADRSVALVDQALRRRFSFLEMAPDAAVLAGWLREHPPTGGSDFAQRVLDLFDRLNGKLAFELGATATVGHSVFMVPALDEEKLRLIWSHHVLPLVQEQVAGRPERLAGYELERLEREPRRKSASKRE
jgi:hypothetical protein